MSGASAIRISPHENDSFDALSWLVSRNLKMSNLATRPLRFELKYGIIELILQYRSFYVRRKKGNTVRFGDAMA